MEKPSSVAVINSTTDIIDLLRRALEQAGFVVITALTPEVRDGEVDIERFVSQHDPRVIVYDIAPPYDSNWKLFQHVASMSVMEGRQFVITSTNVRQLERIAAPQQEVYEIVGKSDDIDRLVQAVKEAMRVRPSR